MMPIDIRIFDPPEEGNPTFRTAGLCPAATAVTMVERHWTPGYFTIEIPTGARHAMELAAGRLVRIAGNPVNRGAMGASRPTEGDGFWGIIDSVSLQANSAGDVLSVEGRQLKGLTMDRITIPPGFNAVVGAQGYDTITGSTETCMKHFVSENMAAAANPARVLFGLEIAPDLGRGVADDKYMSRHEALSDVLAALGEAAQLGYDIIPDLSRGRFVFDITAGDDHTAGQSDRKRVIFDVRRKTAMAQQYQYSAGDSRNLFYTTLAGSEFADEALTVTYVREGEPEPVGIRRRETHLELSVNTPVAGDEYNELRRLALIQMEDYRPAESFTVEVGEGPYVYGSDYRVGDLVTVRNQDWGVTMDARLTEMQTQWSSAGVSRSATFGKAPLNVFGRLRREW